MAAPHENGIPAAGGLQTTVVYQRCVARQLRVLEAKIARLELQMNEETEKISTCSELLDETITKPSSGSSVSGLQKELDRARAKRDKVSQDFQRKNQQEIQGNSAADGDGGALPPAADADGGALHPTADGDGSSALPPAADGDGGASALPPTADGDGGALPPAADDAKSK